jgi:acetyl/propionyl-CoA carboxylase alpha subunit
MSAMRKVLIANRGEIGVQILLACRARGLRTVAVYSDADRRAYLTQAADEAVRLGPAPPGESYLAMDRILDAARRTGADAVHPGYGFLAENADFAQACLDAGITFIGPTPDAIRLMGSKAAGRELAASLGIPVVPGGARPEDAGFPLMIKASAGGGGRGMRIVRDAGDLDAAVESARREAEKAFGDGTLVFERYVPAARHVEVQIFGDAHGNVVHLFERDCSLQRRHQKFIEEAPSPAVTPELRKKLCDAALTLARGMHYQGAGTVEFLLGEDGEFYFIEVNTRIQVEYPVTAIVTGVDLLGWQLEVARGESLTRMMIPAAPVGHAIEARLCAEDPRNGFVPATGVLAAFRPHWTGSVVHTGYAEGDTVTPHYDSLLAKIIGSGATREAAIHDLTRQLHCFQILGVTTNRDYLWQVLRSAEFREGRATTAFLPDPEPAVADGRDESARALALFVRETERQKILPGIAPYYRNNPWRTPSLTLHWHGEKLDVPFADAPHEVDGDFVRAEFDGVQRTYRVRRQGSEYSVASSAGAHVFTRPSRFPAPQGAHGHQAANSPMPGQVLRILVAVGQAVQPGQPLVVLEAMKMEQTVRAQVEGRVSEIRVRPGDQVAPGQTLVSISDELEEQK